MTSSSSAQKKELHIAMFPWLAFGHISPFVLLCNRLSLHDGIKISFLSPPSIIPRIRSSLHSPDLITFVPLSLPAVPGLPPGLETTADMTPHMAELLKKAVDAMQPQIMSIFSSLRPHLVLFDFGQQWLPSLLSPLNVKTLFFSVFSAMSTAYMMVPARLPPTSQAPPSVDDLRLPPPGFPPTTAARLSTFEARDASYVFKTFDCPSVFQRVLTCFRGCSGIVIKSCMEMEAPFVEFIEAQFGKPVLLAGPVVPGRPVGKLDRQWADWLGRFPERSVVFCSFGSETFLGDDQIRELLLGLEMAGAPFIAVLNFPVEDAGADAEVSSRLRAKLPEGFEERVKDRGVVHSGWVQQLHILAHVSVGCYVSHAGLTSVVEAMANDCQLVLLPQKSDQFMNSRLVAGHLRAAVEVRRDDETGFFLREDLRVAIETVTKKACEEPGESIRENHRKWKEFLRDEETHERFTRDFVEKMKEMVYGGGDHGNSGTGKLDS